MESMAATQRKSSWVPWIFVLGMAVTVVVNGALVYFAFSSWSGLTTERPYERGLAYNRNIEAQERQDALGWNLTASLRRDRDDVVLAVAAENGARRALDGLAIAVALERPMGAAGERRVDLKPAGDGRYVARVGALQKGQWDARIVAIAGADRVFLTQRLFLP